MRYSEARIQLGLWNWLYNRGQRWACPNVCKLYDTGECDLLTIMRSGLACEYEIKVSRKDYRQEARKGRVELFERRLLGLTTYPYRYGIGNKRIRDVPLRTPNFFSYVVPNKLVAVEELPSYAGLIYVMDDDCRRFEVIKKPLKIHSEIPPDLKEKLGQKLMFRFWDLRSRELKRVGDATPTA